MDFRAGRGKEGHRSRHGRGWLLNLSFATLGLFTGTWRHNYGEDTEEIPSYGKRTGLRFVAWSGNGKGVSSGRFNLFEEG